MNIPYNQSIPLLESTQENPMPAYTLRFVCNAYSIIAFN